MVNRDADTIPDIGSCSIAGRIRRIRITSLASGTNPGDKPPFGTTRKRRRPIIVSAGAKHSRAQRSGSDDRVAIRWGCLASTTQPRRAPLSLTEGVSTGKIPTTCGLIGWGDIANPTLFRTVVVVFVAHINEAFVIRMVLIRGDAIKRAG